MGTAGDKAHARSQFTALLTEELGRLVDAAVAALTDLDPSIRQAEVLCHTHAGPSLQTLLLASKGDPERLESLIRLSLGATSARGWTGVTATGVQALCEERSGSHLLECVLGVAPEETLVVLASEYLKGRLGHLAMHPIGNFVVQAALSAPNAPASMVEAITAELVPILPSLLQPKSRKDGIVAALANAGLRVDSGKAQRQLTKALSRALSDQASEVTNPVVALLAVLAGSRGKSLSALVGEAPADPGARNRPGGKAQGRLPVMGCVAMSALVQYPGQTASTFWEGIVALAADDVLALARDPSGCRVLESFLDSTAPFRQRRHVLDSLVGQYGALAASASGARLVERCFSYMDLDAKGSLAAELVANETAILSKPWGQYVFANLDIKSFKQGGEETYKNKRVPDCHVMRRGIPGAMGFVSAGSRRTPRHSRCLRTCSVTAPRGESRRVHQQPKSSWRRRSGRGRRRGSGRGSPRTRTRRRSGRSRPRWIPRREKRRRTRRNWARSAPRSSCPSSETP